MKNAEFYKTSEELKAAHAAFREATKDLSPSYAWVRTAAEDPYFFATKPADTALQPGLETGSLVKIVTNLHGEGTYPHYAVVTGHVVGHRSSDDVACRQVTLRFSNGSEYSYDVNGRILPSVADETGLKRGDIKACDLPPDVVKLMMSKLPDKCPLKEPGACMK